MASKGKQAVKASSSASKSASSSSDSSSSTSNSACVIIPPMDLWDKIQEIRSANDTSFDRWPPHINLLWPFLPQTQFNDAHVKVASNPKFKRVTPFTVRLSTFSFTQGSKYLHWVADIIDPNTGDKMPWPPVQLKGKRKEAVITTPMQDLFQLLMELFPGCERPFLDEHGNPSEYFLPHMSVGQVDQPTIRDTISQLQSNWAPIEFQVTEIAFLARAGPNKPFQTILTVPLEGT
jgi:hypothetical protein